MAARKRQEGNMETFELIERMRERPGVWLGKKSISLLNVFLYGYGAAEMDYNIRIEQRQQLLPLSWWFMHEFAKIKCNEYESTAGWCNIILNHCGGEEEAALDKFYEFFDEFRLLKMESGRKALLSRENMYYNDSMEHCRHVYMDRIEPCYKNPIAVYITELSENNGFVMAVETEEKIEIERKIFRSYEKAEEFAEIHFGKIENWQEIKGDNIDFGKPVR